MCIAQYSIIVHIRPSMHSSIHSSIHHLVCCRVCLLYVPLRDRASRTTNRHCDLFTTVSCYFKFLCPSCVHQACHAEWVCFPGLSMKASECAFPVNLMLALGKHGNPRNQQSSHTCRLTVASPATFMQEDLLLVCTHCVGVLASTTTS